MAPRFKIVALNWRCLFYGTKERRNTILRCLNHAFDGNARRLEPGLTEEQRYDLALTMMVEQGVTEISDMDMEWALNNAIKVHMKRLEKPARDGLLMTEESVERANTAVNYVLDIFLRRK